MKNAFWIVGASSGIGLSLAKFLITNKINIIVSSRNVEKLKLNFEASEYCKIIPLDITNNIDVNEVNYLINSEFNLKGVINCAGIFEADSAIKQNLEVINKTMQINFFGAVNLIKSILPKMIENKNGKIINILSVVTDKIFTNSSAYTASKMALLGYTNVLREEIRNYNIKVINIFPGAVKTDIWSEKLIEKYGERMMNPDDLAKIIYDVLIDESSCTIEEIKLKPIKGDL